jgi:1-deoxy-D-xylulose-5-phosphate synthase
MKTIRELVLACNGTFIVVEEGCIHGGVGSAILEVLHDIGIPLRCKLMGIPDKFVEHGPLRDLRKILGLDATGIYKTVKDIL